MNCTRRAFLLGSAAAVAAPALKAIPASGPPSWAEFNEKIYTISPIYSPFATAININGEGVRPLFYNTVTGEWWADSLDPA